MIDISVDLETLDIRPSSYILSIGAVAFDIDSGNEVACFSAVIGFGDESQDSRSISPAVQSWWLGQSAEALAPFSSPNFNTLIDALENFRVWCIGFQEATVWGKGATFDISILEHAYAHNPPWEFRNVGDVRTLLRLAKSKGYTVPDFKGAKHTALDDSRHQARLISESWNYV